MLHEGHPAWDNEGICKGFGVPICKAMSEAPLNPICRAMSEVL